MKTQLQIPLILVTTIISSSALAGAWETKISCGARLTRIEQGNLVYEKSDLVQHAVSTTEEYTHFSGKFEFKDGNEVAYLGNVGGKSFWKVDDVQSITLEATYQRKLPNQSYLALATRTSSSDEIFSQTSLDSMTKYVIAGFIMENPEYRTARLNYGKPASVFSLVKEGLLPEGFVSDVQINCMRIRQKI